VVTNVAIKLEEFRAYLDARGFKGELERRLELLSENEPREFYLRRGRGRVFRKQERSKELSAVIDCSREWIETPALAREMVLDGVEVKEDNGEFYCLPGNGKGRPGGVVYVMDEAHVHFDSRAWATTGPSVTYYNTQHRKLSDEVVFVTQHVELCEKRFRLLAQEFIYLKNLAKTRFAWGLFGAPSLFVRSHYLQPVTGQGQTAMEVRTFTLNTSGGLCECYDTAAGVGFVGATADKGDKRRGMPWPVAATIIGAALVGLYFVPDAIGGVFGHFIDKVGKGAIGNATPATNQVRNLATLRATNSVPAVAPSVRPASVAPVETNGVEIVELPTVRGVSRLAGIAYLALDDGSTVRFPEGQVLEVAGKVVCPLGVLEWSKLLQRDAAVSFGAAGRGGVTYGPRVSKRATVNFQRQ